MYSHWVELVDRLYTPRDREKIEWSVGAMAAGNPKILVFSGSPRSGKTTVIRIIEGLIGDRFQFLDYPYRIWPTQKELKQKIVVHTTGFTHPFKLYMQLVTEVNSDLDSILNHCKDVYQKLGSTYYDEG
jgi:hypothetical protein